MAEDWQKAFALLAAWRAESHRQVLFAMAPGYGCTLYELTLLDYPGGGVVRRLVRDGSDRGGDENPVGVAAVAEAAVAAWERGEWAEQPG